MTIEYPNLAGIATDNLVEKIGGGGFSAAYINWSRTMHLLREHAPGWLPELVHNSDGGLMHRTPIGAYLLIRFVHVSGATTPPVPQAIMNNKNNSIPLEAITSRDLTDTQVRGICKAAALTFGLAYELWAKMPLESGYAEQEKPVAKQEHVPTGKPLDGVWEALSADEQAKFIEYATIIGEWFDNGQPVEMFDYYTDLGLDSDGKCALWTQLPSKIRTAITKEGLARKVSA